MNLLLISRPGIQLLRSLRESETAWDAIRFYGPVSLSIGVYIPVSTLAGAISLASDLKYFLKKYTTDHLFQIKPGIYYTAALTRSRYLTRGDDVSEDWPFKLVYWVENLGRVIRIKKEDWNSEEILHQTMETTDISSNQASIDEELLGGYLLEVWCTKLEFDII